MKKHIQKIFLLLFLGVTQMGIAQSNKAFKTVEMSVGRGGENPPSCKGLGLCQRSSTLVSNTERATINNRSTAFLNHSGNFVMKVYKENLSLELTDDLAYQNMYYLKTDTPVNSDVQQALQVEKPIVLAKGWHPMIELEDCYIISYTLKEENK